MDDTWVFLANHLISGYPPPRVGGCQRQSANLSQNLADFANLSENLGDFANLVSNLY